MSDLSQFDWSALYRIKETQAAYSFLHQILRNKIEDHIKMKSVGSKYKDKLPWVTEELKGQIQKKNKLYKKSKRYPTQLNKNNYKKFKRILAKKMSNVKRSYYNNKLDEYKSNVKKYWEVIREILNKDKKVEYPMYFNETGTSINDECVISNKFNDFFVNIGPNLARQIPQDDSIYQLPRSYSQSFFLEPTSVEEIRNTIRTLNKAAAGWDEITYGIFMSISDFLLRPLEYVGVYIKYMAI